MGQLVEFPSADGGTVLVEVAEGAAGAPVTRGMRDSGVIGQAQHTFEDAVRRVEPAIRAVVDQVRTIAQSPDEIHVEFGLDLHAEAGAFIAKACTTANFAVKIVWHRTDPASGQA